MCCIAMSIVSCLFHFHIIVLRMTFTCLISSALASLMFRFVLIKVPPFVTFTCLISAALVSLMFRFVLIEVPPFV